MCCSCRCRISIMTFTTSVIIANDDADLILLSGQMAVGLDKVKLRSAVRDSPIDFCL